MHRASVGVLLSGLMLVGLMPFLQGCASGPAVKKLSYAQLKNQRTFEYEFPAVWNAIESVLRNHRVAERDPDEVDASELRELPERTLETDWIYSQSRDKYHEYRINGAPRKKPLQMRFKHRITAKRVLGGTEVIVSTTEEIERLDGSGNPLGYEATEMPDPARSNEILEKINLSLLSAPPGSSASGRFRRARILTRC